MSYTRECRTCGQRISLREMPDGQWVAFDVSTQNVHEHYKKTSAKDNNIYTTKTSKKSNVWSGDDDDMLEEFFEEGKSIKYIANYFKVTTAYIEKKLDALGYIEPLHETTENISKSGELWTDDEEEYLVNAKAEGLTSYEIAEELGRTEKAVERKYSKIPAAKLAAMQSRSTGEKNTDETKIITHSPTIAKYVYKAIENQRALTINYETENDRIKSKRTIYPLKIHQHLQKKYLEAYCNLRKDNRMFRISNITRLEYLNKEFAGNIYKPHMTYKPYETSEDTNNQTVNQTEYTSYSPPKEKTPIWLYVIGFVIFISIFRSCS